MALLNWPSVAMATPAKDFVSDFTRSFFEKIRVLSGTEEHEGDRGRERKDCELPAHAKACGAYDQQERHVAPGESLNDSDGQQGGSRCDR